MNKLTNEQNWRGDKARHEGESKMAILDTSDWNWGDTNPPELIPAGTRTVMKIIRTEAREVQATKRKYLTVTFEPVEYPQSDDIYVQFYYLSDSTLTPKERNRESRKWAALKSCFNLHLPDNGQVQLEDWIGAEGRVEIGQRQDNRRGMVNTISEYLNMNDGDHRNGDDRY